MLSFGCTRDLGMCVMDIFQFLCAKIMVERVCNFQIAKIAIVIKRVCNFVHVKIAREGLQFFPSKNCRLIIKYFVEKL